MLSRNPGESLAVGICNNWPVKPVAQVKVKQLIVLRVRARLPGHPDSVAVVSPFCFWGQRDNGCAFSCS